MSPATAVPSSTHAGSSAFVLRCLLTPLGGRRRRAIDGPGCGAAAALRADRDTSARLAESGVAILLEGPGDGPLAERGTLRIDMAGPASLLPQATRLLAQSLTRGLRSDAAPAPNRSDDPGERALQILEDARDEAAPADSAASFSLPGQWRLLAGLVSPFGEAVARSALDPVAAAAARRGGRRAARDWRRRCGVAILARPAQRLDPGIAQGRLTLRAAG
jgi:hypothetical protein